jgi:hypothetical protein
MSKKLLTRREEPAATASVTMKWNKTTDSCTVYREQEAIESRINKTEYPKLRLNIPWRCRGRRARLGETGDHMKWKYELE